MSATDANQEVRPHAADSRAYRVSFFQELTNPPDVLVRRVACCAIASDALAWLVFNVYVWQAWLVLLSAAGYAVACLFVGAMSWWTQERSLRLDGEVLRYRCGDPILSDTYPLRFLYAYPGLLAIVVVRHKESGRYILVPKMVYQALGLNISIPRQR